MSEPASGDGDGLPALDRQRLLDAVGDDERLAAKLVGILADEAERLAEVIRAARASGDLPAVADAAHSLKGSACTLGFVRLGEAAGALEAAAAAGRDIAGPCAAVDAVIGDPAAHRYS